MKEGKAVLINRKVYPTVIDEHGVRRFPQNKLIRHLVDSGKVDLNRLSIDYHNGKFGPTEYMEFYMALGYSVSGLGDFHVFFNPDTEEYRSIGFAGQGWDMEDIE